MATCFCGDRVSPIVSSTGVHLEMYEFRGMFGKTCNNCGWSSDLITSKGVYNCPSCKGKLVYTIRTSNGAKDKEDENEGKKKKLSSDNTSFGKEVLGAIYFGFLGMFILYGVPEMIKNDVEVHIYAFCVMGFIVGFYILKITTYDYIDEVWDNGNELIIVNSIKKDIIPLTNITRVYYGWEFNTPTVVLYMREPSKFGQIIKFSAPFTLNPFKTPPVIVDLIKRVEEINNV